MRLPKPNKIVGINYIAGLSSFKRKLVKIKLSANESALGPSPKAKKEYNKEQLRDSTEKMTGRLFMGNGVPVNTDEIFDMVWSRLPESEMENPPAHWIPKDDKLKKWNEIHNAKDNKEFN